MRSTTLGAFLAAALPTIALAIEVPDHLKCERVRDPLKVSATADLVGRLHPELSATGCIISRPKLFCSPVAPRDIQPAPPRLDAHGEELLRDYVCYRTRCPLQTSARTVTDEFGSRRQQQSRTAMLCVPTITGCVPTTCAAGGADCGSVPDGCGGTLQCGSCIRPDTCGGAGQANVCGSSTLPGTCASTPLPSSEPLGSGCRLPFPPSAGVACPIDEPGDRYYVSATGGSDGNDGRTPQHAWATVCHALQAAPSGSTVRVATGSYTTAGLDIDRPLTVKGGFDASFSTWDPDQYPTVFTGALSLRHDQAVFGGFRLISRPVGVAGDPSFGTWHRIEAGTLVRNYIEIVYQASPDQYYFFAIGASAPAGRTSRIRCNDIYVRGAAAEGVLLVDGIEYGNTASHLGTAELSSNRMCVDGPSSGWVNTVVDGNGTCGGSPARVVVVDNVIENTVGDGFSKAMEFYGCQSDLDLVLTNNTILSAGDGLTGYGNSSGIVRWTLTNNILVGTTGRGAAVNVGTGAAQIPASQGNLIFGFADNRIRPTALFTAGDDTTGGWTPSQVFVAAASGDFHPRPSGAAVDTGLNVYGQAAYGSVVSDLDQRSRPMSASWDRGAFEQ